MSKGFYAIIPANIRYDNEVPPNAKLLYSEITALCNEKGYCWANNDYFADLYSTTDRTIRRWLNILSRKGYITVDYQYKTGTKEILRRYIRLSGSPAVMDTDNQFLGEDKNVHTCGQKCPGVGTKMSGGEDKNVRDNNINNNNIYINNNICHSDHEELKEEDKPRKKDIYETVMELYIKTCTKLPKPVKLTDKRRTSIKKLFASYTLEQIETAFKIINDSNFCTGTNDRGWKADFDFCIDINKVTNALEGKYKNAINTVNQNKTQDKSKPMNRFHNFQSNMAKYSESDLEDIARRKTEKLIDRMKKSDMDEE